MRVCALSLFGSSIYKKTWQMTSRGFVECEFLVLRKTPYSESSLVVAGIAPEQGLLQFLVRGARKVGRRSFPSVDVFRTLRVQFRAGRSSLLSWHTAELAVDYARVARDITAFNAAAWLARFALANVMPNSAHERFFGAMCVALQRLATGQGEGCRGEQLALAARVCACLVYLDEAGLLPAFADDARSAHQCAVLLAAGAGERTLPVVGPETWQALFEWTSSMLRQAECVVPNL